MVGPFAQAFDLISSEYGWDDDVILDKSLRRIRQIIAAITLRKREAERNDRLKLSWQTRSIAMVSAAAGANTSEQLTEFAANLTIDNEELETFQNETKAPPIKLDPKVPVHSSTQDDAVQKNFDAAADRNNFDMLAMFGMSVEKTPPGQ